MDFGHRKGASGDRLRERDQFDGGEVFETEDRHSRNHSPARRYRRALQTRDRRDSMLAKMQSAQARIKVQEQLDGLSVDAEVKALDNVRQHIKTTIAEANLGKELSESSLDSRLAALRTQTGDVQAKQQLAELKAKKAAQQSAQTNKSM
jgi:phage shock protein A